MTHTTLYRLRPHRTIPNYYVPHIQRLHPDAVLAWLDEGWHRTPEAAVQAVMGVGDDADAYVQLWYELKP